MKVNARSFVGILAAALLLPALSYARGGDGSGGGTAIQPTPHEHPVLLDYYIANSRFADSPSAANDRILPSTLSKTIGYDRLDIKTLPSYVLAQNRLKAWEKNSPVVVNLIRSALDSMEWSYTPFRQDLCGEAKIANEQLNFGLPLESAVVYRKEMGAIISARTWNAMGSYSHGGLLVHEALRQIQFAMGEPMEYAVLMNLTAKIMLENPDQQPAEYTLDQAQWFNGKIKDEIAFNHEVAIEVRAYCQSISDLEQRMPALVQSLDALKQEFCHTYLPLALNTSDNLDRAQPMLDEQSRVSTYVDALLQAARNGFESGAVSLAQYNEILNNKIELTRIIIQRNEHISDRALDRALGELSAIGRATVALSGGFSEEALRTYLSDDHSGYSIFTRPKINHAIEQAQAKLQQMMQDNFSLRCE